MDNASVTSVLSPRKIRVSGKATIISSGLSADSSTHIRILVGVSANVLTHNAFNFPTRSEPNDSDK